MNKLEKKIFDRIADEWSQGNCKNWLDLKQWLTENSDNIGSIFDEFHRVELTVRIALEEFGCLNKREKFWSNKWNWVMIGYWLGALSLFLILFLYELMSK